MGFEVEREVKLTRVGNSVRVTIPADVIRHARRETRRSPLRRFLDWMGSDLESDARWLSQFFRARFRVPDGGGGKIYAVYEPTGKVGPSRRGRPRKTRGKGEKSLRKTVMEKIHRSRDVPKIPRYYAVFMLRDLKTEKWYESPEEARAEVGKFEGLLGEGEFIVLARVIKVLTKDGERYE